MNPYSGITDVPSNLLDDYRIAIGWICIGLIGILAWWICQWAGGTK